MPEEKDKEEEPEEENEKEEDSEVDPEKNKSAETRDRVKSSNRSSCTRLLPVRSQSGLQASGRVQRSSKMAKETSKPDCQQPV